MSPMLEVRRCRCQSGCCCLAWRMDSVTEVLPVKTGSEYAAKGRGCERRLGVARPSRVKVARALVRRGGRG
eukprot:6202146-Pleurochrysis_carterae.AAC.2